MPVVSMSFGCPRLGPLLGPRPGRGGAGGPTLVPCGSIAAWSARAGNCRPWVGGDAHPAAVGYAVPPARPMHSDDGDLWLIGSPPARGRATCSASGRRIPARSCLCGNTFTHGVFDTPCTELRFPVARTSSSDGIGRLYRCKAASGTNTLIPAAAPRVCPRSNEQYWIPKLRRTVERDAKNLLALADMGWAVEVVWSAGRILPPSLSWPRASRPELLQHFDGPLDRADRVFGARQVNVDASRSRCPVQSAH